MNIYCKYWMPRFTGGSEINGQCKYCIHYPCRYTNDEKFGHCPDYWIYITDEKLRKGELKMEKPSCKCAEEKMGPWVEGVYPYIDVPMFYQVIARPAEKKTCQLKHNFCPQCGKPYMPQDDKGEAR